MTKFRLNSNIPRQSGEEVLAGMEYALIIWPTLEVEVGTITEGLNSPEYDGHSISAISVSKEWPADDELHYFASYYDFAQDGTLVLPLKREEAVLLLDVAARYFYFEEDEQAKAEEEDGG